METTALQWTANELMQIRNAFFRDGGASCPNDGARLAIEQDMTTGQSRIVIALCPNCQRKATNF